MGTWRQGDIFLFPLPKGHTLAEKGGYGESLLILLKARMWLTMADDEPLTRDGTHCSKTGNAMFGENYPSDQEDAKLKFEREKKSAQEKV